MCSKISYKKCYGTRHCVTNDTTPTLFAFGELYCFAVIFVFRRVIFATRVSKANRISLLCLQSNTTLAKQKYHAVKDSISLKTIRKCALTHHRRWLCYKNKLNNSPPRATNYGYSRRYILFVFKIGLGSVTSKIVIALSCVDKLVSHHQ